MKVKDDQNVDDFNMQNIVSALDTCQINYQKLKQKLIFPNTCQNTQSIKKIWF